MELLIVEPGYPVNTLISRFIYYRGYSASGSIERLLPDGNTQIALPLDDGPRTLLRNTNSSDISLSQGWITGLQTQAVDYCSEINASTLCIQLKPGALARLCGHETQVFTNWMISIDLLPESPLKELKERLLGLESGESVIATAQAFLMDHLVPDETEGKLIQFVIHALASGSRSVEAISEQTGYSHKHLIHRFKRAVGVTPKAYQRLLRFNEVLHQLHGRPTSSLADLAALNNYCDQPHFTQEFKYFSGYSPNQYLRQTRPYPHVVSLA